MKLIIRFDDDLLQVQKSFLLILLLDCTYASCNRSRGRWKYGNRWFRSTFSSWRRGRRSFCCRSCGCCSWHLYSLSIYYFGVNYFQSKVGLLFRRLFTKLNSTVSKTTFIRYLFATWDARTIHFCIFIRNKRIQEVFILFTSLRIVTALRATDNFMAVKMFNHRVTNRQIVVIFDSQ